MYKPKYLTISTLLIMFFSLVGPFDVSARPLGAISPTLGAAASYSVLAGSAVTNTGPSNMTGDLGISPGIGPLPHHSGFIFSTPPGAGVVGPPGMLHDADPNAALAQADNTAAFTFLDQVCSDPGYQFGAGVVDLTGANLLPGVYCADAFILSGNLTLNGTSGVWIFKSASTLTTSARSSVTGGDPCNVWWRLVSSGSTFGANSTLIGNVLALTAVAMQDGAAVNGRVMTQTAEVTMISNNVFGPVCTTTTTTTTTEDETEEEEDNSVRALPFTGGAPIQDDYPWILVFIGVFSALAIGLGVRQAYRRTHLPK